MFQSWEALPSDTATFTPDITPLILAAHRDNYEIIKILLDRGSTLPMPHDVRCGWAVFKQSFFHPSHNYEIFFISKSDARSCRREKRNNPLLSIRFTLINFPYWFSMACDIRAKPAYTNQLGYLQCNLYAAKHNPQFLSIGWNFTSPNIIYRKYYVYPLTRIPKHRVKFHFSQ